MTEECLVAQTHLCGQRIGQKDIGFDEEGIEVVVKFDGGIGAVLCRTIALIIEGIPVFRSKSDSAKRTQLFVKDCFDLGELLFLIYVKGFEVHPKHGVGKVCF